MTKILQTVEQYILKIAYILFQWFFSEMKESLSHLSTQGSLNIVQKLPDSMVWQVLLGLNVLSIQVFLVQCAPIIQFYVGNIFSIFCFVWQLNFLSPFYLHFLWNDLWQKLYCLYGMTLKWSGINFIFLNIVLEFWGACHTCIYPVHKFCIP